MIKLLLLLFVVVPLIVAGLTVVAVVCGWSFLTKKFEKTHRRLFKTKHDDFNNWY